MKVTLEQIMVFRANAEIFIRGKERSKFVYAIEKMISQTSKFDKIVGEKLADLRVEHASVDEKGNLIIINDAYQYTKENRKKLDSDYRKILKEEVEVEPYQASDIPEDMRVDFQDILLPFLTKPEMIANKEEKAAE